MYARRLSQAAKRNALQRRCEIDPLSGTSCTSVANYHMSSPRVELDNINQADDRRDSSLRASLDRHRLLGIEPVVDPISPMLCQLCARAEKRERSVANVEFRSRGAAVDVDQICFGLAPSPSFLRAICSFPSFGIGEIRRDRLISRCQRKYQQIGRLVLTFYQCFQRSSKIFSKIWNRTNGLSYCFYWYFQLGAPGRQSPSIITN